MKRARSKPEVGDINMPMNCLVCQCCVQHSWWSTWNSAVSG